MPTQICLQSIFLSVFSLIAVSSCAQDLFIATYLENRNDKCIQLFNPTDHDVSLTGNYDLRIYFNGGTTVTVNHLEGIIKSGGTHTLCSNSLGVYSDENLGPGPNGDDGIVLEHNGIAIDVFGSTNCDPGDAWRAANGLITRGAMLVRKPCINQGNTENDCGFSSLGEEWILYPPDDLSHLGSHEYAKPSVTIIGSAALCDDPFITLTVEGSFEDYQWSTGETASSIIVNSAGTYSLTVTSSNGCTAVGLKEINGVSPALAAEIVHVQMVSCLPKEDGGFRVLASGGIGNYTYSWEGGTSDNPVFDNIGAGSYSITVSDGNACTVVLPVTVSGPATIPLQLAVTDETCINSQDGSISLSGNGGVGQLQFNINDNVFSSNSRFTDLTPGNYKVRVVDETGCGDQQNVIVREGSRIQLQESILTQTKCLSDGGGQIIFRPSGGQMPFEVSWDAGPFQTNLVVSGLEGGTHNFVLRDANGCEKHFEQYFEEGSDLDVSFTSKAATCEGVPDGAISFEVTGGTGPIYHKIDDDVRPYFNISAFENLTPGRHKVVVGDALYCEVVQEIVIEEEFILETNIIYPIRCTEYQEAWVTALAQNGEEPYQYSLNHMAFGEMNHFGNLSAGFHELMARDNRGCISRDTVEFYPVEQFEIRSIETKGESCTGSVDGSITFNTNAIDNTVLYSVDGINYSNEPTITGLSAGTYTVYAQKGSCIDSSFVHIALNTNIPDTILDYSLTCDPARTGVFIQREPGPDGCSDIRIRTVDFNIPDTTWISSVTCQPSEAGISSVIYANAWGCDSIVNTTTTFLTPDTIFSYLVTCDPGDVDQEVIILTNRYGCDSVVIEITELVSGDTVYVYSRSCDKVDVGTEEVRMINQFGCDSLIIKETIYSGSDTTFITKNTCNTRETGITVYHLANQYLCDSVIKVMTSLSPDHFISREIFTCIRNETGFVRQELTNQFGCDSIVETTIKMGEAIDCEVSFLIQSDSICWNEEFGKITLEPTSGRVPFTYEIWEERIPDSPLTGTINNIGEQLKIEGLQPGSYFVRVTSKEGISRTLPVSIIRLQPLEIREEISNYGGFQVSCQNNADGYIQIEVNEGLPPFYFQWENGQKEASIHNLREGNYGLTVTDGRNCSISRDFLLTAGNLPSIQYELSEQGCKAGAPTDLIITEVNGVDGKAEYSVDGIRFVPFNVLPYTIRGFFPGTNELFIRNDLACTIQEEIHIPFPIERKLKIGDKINLRLGDSITLRPVANFEIDRYEWESNFPVPCITCDVLHVRPTTSAYYKLTAYDDLGCSVTDMIKVNVEIVDQLYIPNAFSPNEDGWNDIFRIYTGKAVARIRKIQIIDYEGRLIYQVVNPSPAKQQEGWDGSFNGEKLLPSVFMVFVESELINGTVKNYVQTVTLIR